MRVRVSPTRRPGAAVAAGVWGGGSQCCGEWERSEGGRDARAMARRWARAASDPGMTADDDEGMRSLLRGRWLK